CTIERMAFIAASHIRFDEHLHSSKWSVRSIAPGSIRGAALHSHWIEERSGDMFSANIPALSQNFLRLIDMRAAVVRLTLLSAMLLADSSPATGAQRACGASPAGMRQFEYIDPREGGRHLALAVFYPAIRHAAPSIRHAILRQAEPLQGCGARIQRHEASTRHVLAWTRQQ